MDYLICLLTFLFTITVLAIGAALGEANTNNDLLEKCRKQHNVYECVVVAVPKEKEEVYK